MDSLIDIFLDDGGELIMDADNDTIYIELYTQTEGDVRLTLTRAEAIQAYQALGQHLLTSAQ
jgi:hypothetical protein